jgi:hypothetical protein
MEASNLLVEARVVGSVPSVQDREDWLLLTPCLLLGGGEIRMPLWPVDRQFQIAGAGPGQDR